MYHITMMCNKEITKYMSGCDKVGRAFLFLWDFLKLFLCFFNKNTCHFDLDIHKRDMVIYIYF